jgi:hypothetical protein
MSLWTSSVISLLLLQTVQAHAQQANEDNRPVTVEEVAAPAEDAPPRMVLVKKDWNLTRAYSDVFKILSNQNTCSNFYGGPRPATTVLNDFFALVKTRTLSREVSFQMAGSPRLFRDAATGRRYRLFERIIVNTSGSFYQRRTDPMLRYPSDVGDFAPGSRAARALILLHELGHLIQGENGAWLIPDDGYDGPQSEANTMRVQQACHAQLAALK